MNLVERLLNPHRNTIKRWLAQILRDRYMKHDPIIDRLSHHLVTEGDVRSFGELIVEVYEVAYLKAFNECRDKFRELGYNVNIVPETQPKE